MSEEKPFALGIWVPGSHVAEFQKRGYEVSDPQPYVSDEQRRYRNDSIHMVKKAHD